MPSSLRVASQLHHMLKHTQHGRPISGTLLVDRVSNLELISSIPRLTISSNPLSRFWPCFSSNFHSGNDRSDRLFSIPSFRPIYTHSLIYYSSLRKRNEPVSNDCRIFKDTPRHTRDDHALLCSLRDWCGSSRVSPPSLSVTAWKVETLIECCGFVDR